MRNKGNALWAAGSIHPKPRVSFANLPREGVPDVLGRWIRIERPEMDPREERSWPAGTETAQRLSHERRQKLASELGTVARGHGSNN